MLERDEAPLHPAERGDCVPLTCPTPRVRDSKDFSTISENFNHIENSSYNFEHGKDNLYFKV